MIYAGIDAGSRSIKAVLFDQGRMQTLASGLADQGVEQERLAAELSELARQSKEPAIISNMCVVFAETEIIGLLAEGRPLPDVVAGVQNAIATRVSALAGRFISPAASRCIPAWPGRWREFWLVRSTLRRSRNSRAPWAPPSWPVAPGNRALFETK